MWRLVSTSSLSSMLFGRGILAKYVSPFAAQYFLEPPGSKSLVLQTLASKQKPHGISYNQLVSRRVCGWPPFVTRRNTGAAGTLWAITNPRIVTGWCCSFRGQKAASRSFSPSSYSHQKTSSGQLRIHSSYLYVRSLITVITFSG